MIYERASHLLAVPPDSLLLRGENEAAMQKKLARFMTMEAQYPAECRRARAESWGKLVSFFEEW